MLVLASLLGLRLGTPIWLFDASDWKMGGAIAAGYAIGAGLLHYRQWRHAGRVTLTDAITAGSAGFAPVFLYILETETPFSRIVLLAVFVAAVFLLAIPFFLTRWRLILLTTLLLAGVVVSAITSRSGDGLRVPSARAQSESSILSGLYAIHGNVDRNFTPPTSSYYSGGGIALMPDSSLLIVTADGDLVMSRRSSSASARDIQHLPVRVPMNRHDMVAVSGAGSFTSYFRALDVMVQTRGDTARIFVSHHYWKNPERCFVVQISRIDWDMTKPVSSLSNDGWTTVHETAPCLSLVASEPSWPFRGMEGGGQMLQVDVDHLLMTVGDHGFNGVDFETEADLVQDARASYGKTVLVNVVDGTWVVYTTGHRNGQGIARDSTGRIWETEHGPQGGDELNLLVRGNHYGWPVVTYGTDYGTHSWPRNPHQGRHEGYVAPVYSWMPSIGVSAVAVVKHPLFGMWQDDLLVGSMVNKSLWRLHLVGDHPGLVEEIPVGERIRDIVEDDAGRIVLLTDSYTIMVLEPVGSKLVRQ